MSPEVVMKKSQEARREKKYNKVAKREKNVDMKQNVWQHAQAKFSIHIKVRRHKFFRG